MQFRNLMNHINQPQLMELIQLTLIIIILRQSTPTLLKSNTFPPMPPKRLNTQALIKVITLLPRKLRLLQNTNLLKTRISQLLLMATPLSQLRPLALRLKNLLIS